MATTDSYGHHGHYDQGYDQPTGYHQDSYTGQYRDASPAGVPSGQATPAQSQRSDPFEDPRYPYGQRLEPRMALGQVNPNDILDDGDDGLEYGRSARNSMLSLGKTNPSGSNGGGAALAGAAAGGAAAGGLMGARDHYAPAATSDRDLASTVGAKEQQSEWMKKETGSRKKRKWILIGILALLVLGGIAGGVAGGILSKNPSSSSSSASGGGGGGQSASQDSQANGDLDINSSEIKALLNNPNLHKVFPGVDYTPVNTQYPDCLSNPPSQNNVTRDVAVLSQLTNIIRLYGTDCNQTEMTIHALKQLKMDSDMKIWLGVWQDNNATTNARQLAQMWDILDTYGAAPFKGLIVANEILFREQMTETELGTLLSSVRTNLTSKGMSLPVATSDLGDKWTSSLASKSDYIMSNIHPFFGGINAKAAASWTWNFWDMHNKDFFKSDAKANVISEIGWPSQGGMDCGSDTVTNCPDQAVAGITEMNQLLDDWVCDALNNGTNYFWFEMFDEPWKIQFDSGSQNWEDHWGLMDINRKLKDGVTIPDCGGKTVGDNY
jgi:exo-beta-1,3-glucanase (GH17 family)